MSYAEKLKDALRVSLKPGQNVMVRAADGSVVANGWVSSVDPESGVVRVTDDGSGTSVEVDVDSSRYHVWVVPADRIGNRNGGRGGRRVYR